MTPDNLEHDLNRLGESLAPAASLVPGVMTRISATPMQSARVIAFRRLALRVSMGLAACVALVLVTLILFAHPRAAWADVVSKVAQTQSLTFDLLQGDRMMHILIKGDLMRVELGDGKVSIGNRSTGKWLTLDETKKRAMTLTLASNEQLDFYRWMKDFKDGKQEDVGQQELDGRKLSIIRVTRAMSTGEFKDVVFTVWIDPATSLPVQAEARPIKTNATAATDPAPPVILFKNLKFESPLQDALFSMAIPEGYQNQDMGGVASSQLKGSPTTQAAEKLTLKPAVGIGSVKFGDPKDKVIELLGQPEAGSSNIDLRYPSQGLAVMVTDRSGLAIVTAMTKKSAGPFAMNDFTGKTDQGIAMGATRKEIEAAYGPPTKAQEKGDTITLEYTPLNLTFTLFSDHLGQITLLRPPISRP